MAAEISKVIILTNEQYKRLESQLPVYVGKETSDIMAGCMLGQQQVLKLLREGFVSDV